MSDPIPTRESMTVEFKSDRRKLSCELIETLVAARLVDAHGAKRGPTYTRSVRLYRRMGKRSDMELAVGCTTR